MTQPMQSYAELRKSAAWIDLSGRGKIRMTGEDRVRLLHAMTTNHIEQLKPGDGCYAFFLSAQGRILADVNVLFFESSLLLDTEPEARQTVYQHLDQFIIADDVTLSDETDEMATVAVEGPAARAALEQLGLKLPAAEGAWTESEGKIVVRLSHTGSDGWFVLLPSGEGKRAFVESLSLPEADAEAARVVRLEHGQPRYGDEISERFLVQETGEMRAMHFSKGCYMGQEIVERVRSRGQVHRHLMPVRIDSHDVPTAGTKLTAEGKDLAEIVSAAFSPALGKVVAMAYVRTDAARPGFALRWGDASATVEARAA